MALPKITNQVRPPLMELIINGETLPTNCIAEFQWAAKLNGGYTVKAILLNSNNVIRNVLNKSGKDGEEDVINYLKDGRQKPLVIKFSLCGDLKYKQQRIAYVTSARVIGSDREEVFEFLGQDPPTYLLSAGVADGRVYSGKIGGTKKNNGKDGVIAQCIRDFTKSKGQDQPTIEVDVSDTSDSEFGIWPMFRMDPKTYIISLLDWSSSLSDKASSRWIISCKDRKINIKKAAEMQWAHFGTVEVNAPGVDTAFRYDAIMNSSITVYQGNLISSGISATTGDEIVAVIDDSKTPSKVNVFPKNEGEDRSFTKPKRGDNWPQGMPATYIRSIPEHSGGESASYYGNYIDGRARQIYEDALTNVMRMDLHMYGQDLVDPDYLGASMIYMKASSPAYDQGYFLSGNWIVDGFTHVFNKRGERYSWMTKVSLYRLDWDAEALVPKPS